MPLPQQILFLPGLVVPTHFVGSRVSLLLLSGPSPIPPRVTKNHPKKVFPSQLMDQLLEQIY